MRFILKNIKHIFCPKKQLDKAELKIEYLFFVSANQPN